jgi:hypothetical protein
MARHVVPLRQMPLRSVGTLRLASPAGHGGTYRASSQAGMEGCAASAWSGVLAFFLLSTLHEKHNTPNEGPLAAQDRNGAFARYTY